MTKIIYDKITLLNQTTLQSLSQKKRSVILKKFTITSLKILGADFGFAWWNNKNRNYTLAYKTPNTPYNPPLPRKQGTNYQAQKNKTPFFVKTVIKNYLPKKYDVSPYMRSYGIIPIRYKNDVYGTIVICFQKKHIFTEEDKSLSVAIGNSAAQALTIHRLYQNLKDFKEYLDRTLDSIMIFDPKSFQIEYANLGAVEMMKYTRPELLKKSQTDLIFESDQKNFKKIIRPLLQQKIRSLVFESRLQASTGEVIPVETFLQLVVNSNQRPKFLSIAHNITNRKIAERRIQDLMKQKDDFVGIASHELRTPITTIKGFTQLLQKRIQNTDQPTDHFLTKINSQVDKLVRLVDQLLDISKMQSGKLRYENNIINLNELLKNIVEDLQLTTDLHQIQLIQKNKCIVFGDPMRLTQVFTNIIINAIKYSPNGGKIVVKVCKYDHANLVIVKDSGIGIPRKFRKQIFERFFQADETNASNFHGLGLGLFITKEIIRRHRGDIWFKSKVGQGSKFYIKLPEHDKFVKK